MRREVMNDERNNPPWGQCQPGQSRKPRRLMRLGAVRLTQLAFEGIGGRMLRTDSLENLAVFTATRARK
jgi:hypothetical protein